MSLMCSLLFMIQTKFYSIQNNSLSYKRLAVFKPLLVILSTPNRCLAESYRFEPGIETIIFIRTVHLAMYQNALKLLVMSPHGGGKEGKVNHLFSEVGTL